MSDNWLDFTHPEYQDWAPLWKFTTDLYTERYIRDGHIESYLVHRKAGEAAESYDERKRLADPTLEFSTIINTIAGRLVRAENKIKRVWQDEEKSGGLGDPADPQSPAGKLWRNADGAGTSYRVLWRQFIPRLIYQQRPWILVDGLVESQTEGGTKVRREPSINLLHPLSVTDWDKEHESLEWVKVRHEVLRQASPRDKTETVTQWTIYTLDGWQRYEKDAKGNEMLVGEGMYEFWNRSRTARILPIFRVDLPFDNYIAYLLARKAWVLFNLENRRDHLLAIANTPRLIYKADGSNVAIDDQITAGQNFHQIGPTESLDFIAPDATPAENASKRIDEKRRNLWISAYLQYGDAAVQKTATEVREDRAGIESFLLLLSAKADQAENDAMWRMEQIIFPNQPDLWGQYHVERHTDFMPTDDVDEASRQKLMFFGTDPMPLGKTGQINAALRIAQLAGVEVDRQELEAVVTSNLSRIKEVMEVLQMAASSGLAITTELLVKAGIPKDEAEALLRTDTVGIEQ